MRNCLIMGFGRSGTSLMAGILHQSGYFSGDDLYPPRKSNPLGFFENARINGINETILKEYDYEKKNSNPPAFSRPFSPYTPGEGHRWLTCIPPEIEITHCDESVLDSIDMVIASSGYAYKDPRFNYTLGIWNNRIKDDTLYICMVRQPEITIGSVLKECAFAAYLSDFFIDPDLAYQLWYNSYTHLLKNLSAISNDRIMVIHYEQLMNRSIIEELEKRLKAHLDPSFIVQELNRSRPHGTIPGNVLQLYHELCTLSGFRN